MTDWTKHPRGWPLSRLLLGRLLLSRLLLGRLLLGRLLSGRLLLGRLLPGRLLPGRYRAALCLGCALVLGCGGVASAPPATAGSRACALDLDACEGDGDCCSEACEQGFCRACKAAGRWCVLSASCCSGRCSQVSSGCF